MLAADVVLVGGPDEVDEGVVVVPDADVEDEDEVPPPPPTPGVSVLELQAPLSAEAARPRLNKPIKWVIFIAISAARK